MTNSNEKRRRPGRPPINGEPMPTISLRIEQQQYAALVALAEQQGITVSDIYRRCFALGLQHEQHQTPGA